LTEPAAPRHRPDEGHLTDVHLDGGIFPPETMSRFDPSQPTEFSQGMQATELVYETGVELRARSQWAYVRNRFFRHRLAMASLLLLLLILLTGVFAGQIAPYGYAEIDFSSILQAPSGEHYFGTDLLGRDYFTRVLFAIQTSARVAFLVAILSTAIGTLIGALAGYFGGWLDNLLMRFTDLILTLPLIAVLLVASNKFGTGNQYRVALIISLLLWTGIARVVRGIFLSLREKEYVEAAKAAGAGDARIIFRHILPNSMGPIIVNATLTVAAAILIESALSFLGFGIKPPTPALGLLINDGATEMQTAWWLVVFPGVMIMAIVLCINFIGDGLRDALDPTQRRVRA
jgi:ABC-type dipeptide/oligopeptide/nickel transport system permease subunit